MTLTLDVCGDGWWRQSAEKLVRRRGLGDRVRFLGWLSDDELQAAYDRAAVVAVPSVWPSRSGWSAWRRWRAAGRWSPATSAASRTGWSTESRACSRPPATSARCATALRRLLADRELRARMGAAGADRVRRQFTADTHIAAIERVNELARRRWSAAPASPVLR